MEAEFKFIQRSVPHLWHLIEMTQIVQFAPKVLFSIISACTFTRMDNCL